MGAIRVVEVVGNIEGGGTQFVAALLRRMNPSRFQVTLVAPEAPWLADLCADVGAHYRALPLLSSRTNSGVRRRLGIILGVAEPDIVHAHGTRAAWYATRCMPAQLRTPALVYSEHLFSPDARRGLAKLPWYGLEWYLCRRADVITTTCQANAARAVRAHRIGPERIALDHYGIDPRAIRAQAARQYTRAELGLSENALVIGSVGRLIPQKGFSDLIEAMALVTARRPDAICVIVGDGELRASLETLCRRLRLDSRVRFLGAQDEPWRMLACCDMIALSSLYEGLSFALLEALAIGMPVVATRTGGAAEVITSGQNGLLVPRGDPAPLAAAIEQVLCDSSLRAAFREVGPPSVGSYDLEIVLNSMLNLYTSLASSAQRKVRPSRGTPRTAR